MSQHNANAFYELGIRHMIGLPTIHMILRDQKIPFDVAPFRAIQFSYAEADHIETAKSDLKSVVEEVIKPGFVVENPVTHAKGRLELQEHATSAQKVLVDELEALRGRIDRLESDTEREVRPYTIANWSRQRNADPDVLSRINEIYKIIEEYNLDHPLKTRDGG
jgi:hypothetical protein